MYSFVSIPQNYNTKNAALQSFERVFCINYDELCKLNKGEKDYG